jgi:pyridinium-3,5-biscarboxylic acid mononucleotide sulfurtransferase
VKPEVAAKLDAMSARVRSLERVLVAYSGGVDSSLVLEISHQALGEGCLGVIARSPSLPRSELEQALGLARQRGIGVRVLDTAEVERSDYAANGPDRCYFCKSELYQRLGEVAVEVGAVAILDGFNRDDRGDWRPGRGAAAEQGVISPLDEEGLGKEEVRHAARELGLPNWDKPAAACLSSRIPYGIRVTVETLGRIESAERVLRAEGFRQLRVRDANAAATIEVEPEDLPRLLEPRRLARIERRLRGLGYSSVAVDEDGYRRGNLNRALGG